MFAIFYKKSTKHIVGCRTDQTTPSPQSAEYWFDVYLKDNKLFIEDFADLTFVETAYQNFGLETGKYMWNESTKQIEEDPNYVAPTPPAQEATA